MPTKPSTFPPIQPWPWPVRVQVDGPLDASTEVHGKDPGQDGSLVRHEGDLHRGSTEVQGAEGGVGIWTDLGLGAVISWMTGIYKHQTYSNILHFCCRMVLPGQHEWCNQTLGKDIFCFFDGWNISPFKELEDGACSWLRASHPNAPSSSPERTRTCRKCHAGGVKNNLASGEAQNSKMLSNFRQKSAPSDIC